MECKKEGVTLVQDKKWLYVEDIANDLEVNVETVRLWIRQKKLAAYRVGREYRIRPEDYRKFLEESRTIDDSPEHRG